MKNFIILDDDKSQLKLIEKYINNIDFLYTINLSSFYDTKEMMNKINLGLLDLLIIDVNLDDINGFELAQFLRKMTKLEIPIIFISSNENYIRDFYHFEVRNSYFLPKPFSQETFEKVINTFFNSYEQRSA